MHLVMVLFALVVACGLRSQFWIDSAQSGNWSGIWQTRWQNALFSFMLPPSLIVMTAIALLWMGETGQMLGLPTGWFSYALAISFLGYSIFLCLKLAWLGYRSIQTISNYPQQNVFDYIVRTVDTPIMFAAQIGFWQPETVVSHGLLNRLDSEHLAAVLTHEQAHTYYRDTFWFFWLGCIRQIGAWLPNTDLLWEELLLLRELRADRWAAKQVDPILLAESLLWSVSSSIEISENLCAAFSRHTTRDRLDQRIEFLLTGLDDLPQHSPWSFSWSLIMLGLTFLPLTSVLFHS